MPLRRVRILHLPLLVTACRVQLYQHDGFEGYQASFGDGEYNYWRFADNNYPMLNDEVSSIVVEGRGCVAVLYGGPEFDDWSATCAGGV